MGNIDVQEINGRYRIHDYTDGGYENRAVGNLKQVWVTVWDIEMNLIELHLNRMDLTKVVLNKEKDDDNYNRANRARTRHLKGLKDYLGIDYKKQENKQSTEIVHIQRSVLYAFNPISKSDALIHEKTIKMDNSQYKKDALHYAILTPEKAELVRQYNEQLSAFKQYRKDMLELIFFG